MLSLTAVGITSFGAIPNDPSQSARTINAAAWVAAMKAMGTAAAPNACTLLVSGGSFYFPGPVYMTRSCIISGEGGGVNTASRLLFPYNGPGLVADYLASPDDPGRATWGKVENLDIFNEGPGSIVQRRMNWKYAPGDVVISQSKDSVMFKCLIGGDAVDPSLQFDNAQLGDVIQEASGTRWITLLKVEPKISLWQKDTQYDVGDIVFSNGFDLGSQHYGDSRFTYVCTVSGKSGARDPFGAQALDTEVIEPGGLTWRVNVWSAILMRSSIHVDNVSTYRWPNAAIHINAAGDGPNKNNANNFVLTNVKSTNDGMGIYVGGTDANVGFIGYCQALGPGAFVPGTGGHGFWDHSQSGTLWINNYAEDGSGAGWINDSVGPTTWINNVSEMPVPGIVRRGTVTSLGNTPWHPTMTQQLSHFGLTDGRGFATTDCTSRVTTFTQRGIGGVIDLFSTTDEQGDSIVRFYNFDSWRMGWYTDHLWGQNGAFIGGVSGLMAPEGPGHAWTAAGMFVGSYTEKRYVGFDPNIWTSNRLREGKRTVGDVFTTNPNAAPGDWMGSLVTQAGTKGLPWLPNEPYNQKRVGIWNLPADVVEPGDGFAYACTRSGTSGSSKPVFTAATTIGVNAPVWNPNTRYWPSSRVRPTTAVGRFYELKRYPNWTANTPVSPNQIVTTGDSNGNLFFAYVQTWVAEVAFAVGQYAQSFPPNGKVFRVKRVTGITFVGITGTLQPDWSQLVLPTDELGDGSVFWQLDQLTTGSLEPPGVDPQTVGWDTRDGAATYDNNILWHFFVPKTGETEPTWNISPGSETMETPNAKPLPDGSGVENGFGIVWVESGADPADSKVLDNGCEWTRIDTTPVTAKVFPVGTIEEPVMSLTLRQLSLTNVDDAGGRWQFEGGKVFRGDEHIADFASTKRVVVGGTDGQNTAMLTTTLFFVSQASQPAANMTLQGSHDFSSGVEVGSVSAASHALGSFIGLSFKRLGTSIIIQ